ncbi:Internalin-A precursor [Symmachiella macrocystis]|uniref:Internalin-A n=1 Tax=Symmachiella macrocystis TaxID=2527985 RepID=A0A5C6BKZ7_9PLAN|nr:hypothetical protein [Symmachiella macrocystis]TWU12750.1 Internalin-A precursor [Symmachiella macrocystis]
MLNKLRVGVIVSIIFTTLIFLYPLDFPTELPKTKMPTVQQAISVAIVVILVLSLLFVFIHSIEIFKWNPNWRDDLNYEIRNNKIVELRIPIIRMLILKKLAKSRDFGSAIYALERIGTRSAKKTIARCFKNKINSSEASRALCHFKDPSLIVPLVLDQSCLADKELMESAAEILGECEGEQAMHALVRLSKEYSKNEIIVKALCSYDDPKALRAVAVSVSSEFDNDTFEAILDMFIRNNYGSHFDKLASECLKKSNQVCITSTNEKLVKLGKENAVALIFEQFVLRALKGECKTTKFTEWPYPLKEHNLKDVAPNGVYPYPFLVDCLKEFSTTLDDSTLAEMAQMADINVTITDVCKEYHPTSDMPWVIGEHKYEHKCTFHCTEMRELAKKELDLRTKGNAGVLRLTSVIKDQWISDNAEKNWEVSKQAEAKEVNNETHATAEDVPVIGDDEIATIVAAIGGIWLEGLRSISFGLSQTTDVELESIKGFAGLQQLNLFGTQITDVGLEHLKGMTSLQKLELGYTKISDAGLEHLKEISKLSMLDLRGTQITGTGLEHLKGLTCLHELDLSKTKISDGRLKNIKALSNLQVLSLKETQIGNVGLECIKRCTNLKRLTLDKTQVNNFGMINLRGLVNLELLSLNGTDISDLSLPFITAMPNLRELGIGGTRFTNAGISELREALPRCSVV